MNILVMGGGTKNRFGNDFVNRARGEGHRVLVVSHKDHGHNHDDHIVANFFSAEDVVSKTESILNKIDKLDMFLFNTVAGKGPWDPDDFMSDSNFFNETDWLFNLRVNAIIPYNVSIICLKKMSEGAKLVYMTTGRSFNMDLTVGPFIPSYYGGKAFLNHIMVAFAHYNDKKVISTAISGHFGYNDPNQYKRTFEKTYLHIMNIDSTHNAKIVTVAI